MEGSFQTFLLDSENIKKGLTLLKSSIEALLDNIRKSIKLFDLDDRSATSLFEFVKLSIRSQYEALQVAIKEENTAYVINEFNKKDGKFGIEDSEKHLIEALNESILNFSSSKELRTLNELLEELHTKYKTLLHNEVASVKGKYVYGLCKPLSNCAGLCRYDIYEKKLCEVYKVPINCSILQMDGHIFASGGWIPTVNTLYEYIERTKKLISRESMVNARGGHALQKISNNVFVAIGGCNTKKLACCEKYLIKENKWISFSPLNIARSRCTSAFLNDRYLYAIGGLYSGDQIEMLDMKEGKSWSFF